jgi:hypothetical protein
MPGSDVHCKDCKELLGETFGEVHAFLDQYTKELPPPLFYDYHRSLLHNSYGLAVIRARWGERAYEAGRIHLSRDYDDTCPVDKLLDRAPVAIMWFNDLDNMECHIKPYYMASWEESLVSMMEDTPEEGDPRRRLNLK